MRTEGRLLERLAKNWPAKMVCLIIAIFLYLMNRMGNMQHQGFAVPLAIEGGGVMLPANEYPKEVRLNLRGTAEAVSAAKAEDFQAYVDLTGAIEEGEASFPVKVRRRASAVSGGSLEIALKPSSVKLVLERRVVKRVTVRPVFDGAPELGYERATYQVTPSKVEISGPRSLVDKVGEVSTEDVELDGLSEDASLRLGLLAPSNLVRLSGADKVRVDVAIRKALSLRSFDALPIQARNLRAGLRLVGTLPKGRLSVQGPLEDVEGFSPSEGCLYVDLAAVDAGGSRIVVVGLDVPKGLDGQEVPDGLRVSEYGPKEITVNLVEDHDQ